MSSKNFETNTVVGRHYSGSINIDVNFKIYTKTRAVIKLIIGYCSNFNRKKSLTVSGITIETEQLVFFKRLKNGSAKAAIKIGHNVIRNPGKAPEVNCLHFSCFDTSCNVFG